MTENKTAYILLKGRMMKKLALIVLAGALATGLAGCKDVEEAPKAAPSNVSEEVTAVVENNYILNFGQSKSYDTGLKVTVNRAIVDYIPEHSADLPEEGFTYVAFDIEIVNNTGAEWEPILQTIFSVEDEPIASVIDIGHSEFGDLGWRPQDLVAEGGTISWYEIYPIPNESSTDFIFEVYPDFDHKELTFTN